MYAAKFANPRHAVSIGTTVTADALVRSHQFLAASSATAPSIVIVRGFGGPVGEVGQHWRLP